MWQFSFFAPNLISMMGLAVGIDYSLFIVSRYREERQRGRDKLEAIGRSGATANRAVFFSGVTVVLALAGMLLVPTTIFRALAGGAILVVLVSIALSMTLLPALLSFFGTRAEPMSDWLNWPWKSIVGNVLVLLLVFVAAGVGVAIPSRSERLRSSVPSWRLLPSWLSWCCSRRGSGEVRPGLAG